MLFLFASMLLIFLLIVILEIKAENKIRTQNFPEKDNSTENNQNETLSNISVQLESLDNKTENIIKFLKNDRSREALNAELSSYIKVIISEMAGIQKKLETSSEGKKLETLLNSISNNIEKKLEISTIGITEGVRNIVISLQEQLQNKLGNLQYFTPTKSKPSSEIKIATEPETMDDKVPTISPKKIEFQETPIKEVIQQQKLPELTLKNKDKKESEAKIVEQKMEENEGENPSIDKSEKEMAETAGEADVKNSILSSDDTVVSDKEKTNKELKEKIQLLRKKLNDPQTTSEKTEEV
jgi:hypothetical protein